jgi:hypothetical protein
MVLPPECTFTWHRDMKSFFPFLSLSLFHYGMLRKVKKKKVKLARCFTKSHAMKMCGESGGITPRILNLRNRWSWVVSFIPRPRYPRGKSSQHTLDRRLGGATPCIDVVAKKLVLAAAGNRIPVVQPVAHSLHWLSCPVSLISFNDSVSSVDYI